MFVLSLKTSKKKLLIFAVVILAAILGCFLLFGRGGDESYAVSAMGKYSLAASDASSRMAFLAQFGWTANEEPVEICEVIIPAEFNETYQSYNELQKEQGLDLSKYAGRTCKRWTYEITNYPGQTEGVRANLLILDGKVIGGDISSTKLDGFMHGFVSPGAQPQAGESTASVLESAPAPSGTAEASSASTESVAPTFAVESSTERETLAPDPNMPEAPVD